MKLIKTISSVGGHFGYLVRYRDDTTKFLDTEEEINQLMLDIKATEEFIEKTKQCANNQGA